MAGMIPMSYLWLSVLALTLAGCATERAVLVNARGEEITCETRASGIFPILVISNKQQECISEAEKQGYRLKEENSKAEEK